MEKLVTSCVTICVEPGFLNQNEVPVMRVSSIEYMFLGYT